MKRTPSLVQGAALKNLARQIVNADERKCLLIIVYRRDRDISQEGGLILTSDSKLQAGPGRFGFVQKSKKILNFRPVPILKRLG